jgi:hypothetical protein
MLAAGAAAAEERGVRSQPPALARAKVVGREMAAEGAERAMERKPSPLTRETTPSSPVLAAAAPPSPHPRGKGLQRVDSATARAWPATPVVRGLRSPQARSAGTPKARAARWGEPVDCVTYQLGFVASGNVLVKYRVLHVVPAFRQSRHVESVVVNRFRRYVFDADGHARTYTTVKRYDLSRDATPTPSPIPHAGGMDPGSPA